MFAGGTALGDGRSSRAWDDVLAAGGVVNSGAGRHEACGCVVVPELSAVGALPVPAVASFVLEPLPPMEAEVAPQPLHGKVDALRFLARLDVHAGVVESG